jgi:hypothetical protein
MVDCFLVVSQRSWLISTNRTNRSFGGSNMPTSGLTGKNRRFAQRLVREGGPLEKIQRHRIDHTQGVILVCCGDCDQSYDIFTHQVNIIGPGAHPRIHLVTHNAGPLGIVAGSPVNNGHPRDEVILTDIAEAIFLKNISNVVMLPHGVCGKAMTVHGMSLEDVADQSCLAHDRAKNELMDRVMAIHESLLPRADEPEIQAILDNFTVTRVCTSLRMHLDWGIHDRAGNHRETWFMNRHKYLDDKGIREGCVAMARELGKKWPDRVTFASSSPILHASA